MEIKAKNVLGLETHPLPPSSVNREWRLSSVGRFWAVEAQDGPMPHFFVEMPIGQGSGVKQEGIPGMLSSLTSHFRTQNGGEWRKSHAGFSPRFVVMVASARVYSG